MMQRTIASDCGIRQHIAAFWSNVPSADRLDTAKAATSPQFRPGKIKWTKNSPRRRCLHISAGLSEAPASRSSRENLSQIRQAVHRTGLIQAYQWGHERLTLLAVLIAPV